MNLMPRAASLAAPISLARVLAAGSVASAQVASLGAPEETAAPEAAAVVLEVADREEALLAFAQCLREAGIDMDDPSGEGGGRRFFGGGGGPGAVDRLGEEIQVAREACGPILEASRPEVDPAAEQERLEDQLLLAQCYRESGYPEYPDPAIGSDGRIPRGGEVFRELGIDPRSAEFQGVRQTCADQLGIENLGPGGGPRPGGGGN